VCRYTISFDSDTYRVLYCVALVPVRILACLIVFRTSKWISISMLPYAAAMTWIALRGPGVVTVDQWIVIMDGVLVASAGIALAPIAPFIRDRSVYGTLAVLWMLLGLFDFGYALQPYGKWSELNDSLLPVMVIGAFGWIGVTGWSKQRLLLHR
jgi:hypothetical protein